MDPELEKIIDDVDCKCNTPTTKTIITLVGVTILIAGLIVLLTIFK